MSKVCAKIASKLTINRFDVIGLLIVLQLKMTLNHIAVID